ncbi:hypothetical protein CBL_03807 [Carabus blaptoides fortunei]
MLELQEKLRRSEEERIKLEEKFNETMRYTRDAEHERLRVLRHKYHRFLEENRVRQDRNENILRALDRIESRAKTFAAKTDRFKALRKQYDTYIRRIYTIKHQQPEVYARVQHSSDSHPYQSYPNARKQLFADVPPTQRSNTKIAMLEQYLQENFNSSPNEKPRDNVCNEKQMFTRPNGFTAGYELPEDPPENRTNLRQNYRQSETIVDSDSKDSDEYNMENVFPSRRSDTRLMQHELEFVPRLSVKDCLQPKKTDMSELLGNTIEQELDRFRDKESAKEKPDIEVSTPDPYVQNYKDLVLKSAKKLGLHNGSVTKRTSDQNVDIEDEEKINSILKSNDPVSNKIIPDTTSQQREENKVNFAEHEDNKNESPILKLENVEINKEESLGEQQIVSQEPPIDDGEKVEVLEQDDNIDMRSKTPEVSSARTEPPDDVTLTTPSPLSAENIATHKHESLVSVNKKSPVPLDEKRIESATLQSSGISKDLQNDNAQDNLIPQLPKAEQTKSLNENIVTENQNDSTKHESKVGENYGEPNEGFNQNSPVEGPLVEKQPEYEGLQDQPDDNQDYNNVDGQQVYHEEYQPEDGYDPQRYPVQKHVEAQPELYDAEQYHMDQRYPVQEHVEAQPELYDTEQYHTDPGNQQQYAAAEEHYSVDQKQYPAEQEQYVVDQQQYPVDQEQYLIDQQEYTTDQQQYSADQYLVEEQKYPGTEADQHYPVAQQEYPVDKEQYRQDQQYPTDQQEYPTDQEQYPVDAQPYPEHHQQYGTDEQQYAPVQEPYQGEYPPEQYPGEPQQYIEGQPTDYDPTEYPQNYVTDQPYTEGEYEAQQYPDGYNHDVYRSEQEYLQGEQNIDLQYQTEVTGQEYQGEFANQPEFQQADAIEQDHQPHKSISPEQSSSEPVQRQQETGSLPVKQHISDSSEKSATRNVIQPEDKPLVEKKLPNLADMLDTDTESTKQETKVSNDSDFNFSNTS